ncbi:hypothetical protein ACFQ05_41070 [Amycolatopsis umgeniensis]|uniref:BioF2-like acetyltransferase domain-containing protein n=1 Tax=Amycolatopsis umgeniensis TaxID=336628 RepID=A0A841BFC6_9PSEU|nr:hypothetical protein [Amycolatopsis umgeniensis]MBB5857508.1 hypothetical protein [Amycolatopsis umgeniensis]
MRQPKSSAVRRWRALAGYTWNHSSDPLFSGYRTWYDSTARRRLPAFVSYPEPGSGDGALSLGYAGIPDGFVIIYQLLDRQRAELGPVTGVTTDYRVPRSKLLSGAAIPHADLVAVACSPAEAERLPRDSALILPFRRHLVVRVDTTEAELTKRVSKRELERFKANQREHDWRLERAEDAASFEYFYERMHRPTVRSRHGERARSETRDVAYECLFRQGALFFVRSGDGERVAGGLCRWEARRKTMLVRLLGVLDADKQHYDSGAFRAFYHLLLRWCHDNAVEAVDFGGAEAWLSTGIFQWKRKFQPEAVPAPNHLGGLRLWYSATRDTPAVRDYLVAHPVMELLGGDELRAVYFHDDERPARRGLPYRCANVRTHRTVHLDEFLAGLPTDPCTPPTGKEDGLDRRTLVR